MNDAVHNEDLLLRYIDGELSEEEKQEVESRLLSDAAFRNQYIDLRVAVQAVQHLGTMQQVQDVHREMMLELKGDQPAGKVFYLRKVIRYSLTVAASVLLLFVGIRLYLDQQVSPDSLYKKVFVDINLAATRGTDGSLSKIETLYQQKAYGGVISSVGTLTLSDKDSLLIGLSYLHQDNFSSAARWFNGLAASGGEYRPDAEFYLSLSYLKQQEYAKALSLMERIHNDPSHLYHQQVSGEVIKRLRKFNK